MQGGSSTRSEKLRTECENLLAREKGEKSFFTANLYPREFRQIEEKYPRLAVQVGSLIKTNPSARIFACVIYDRYA